MPCYFAFLNCSVAQACSMWTGLLKCVIAFCDHCMGGLLLDFTQQIWIMLKGAVNWRGYANMSQMGTWGADDRDTPTLYGRASVWQVHHSVIKGHIITYNKACMTIAGMNAVPLRVACVLRFLFSFFFRCVFFVFSSSLQICSQLLMLWISVLCKRVCAYLVQTSIRRAITSWDHSLI